MSDYEPQDFYHNANDELIRIKELEQQLMFFLENWEECSEMGFCPDLGYPEEDWCPWCKTRRLLGLPDARNWEEHENNGIINDET